MCAGDRAGLDILFEEVDALLWAGHEGQAWPAVETLLTDERLERASLQFLVGVMFITLPVKTKVTGRDRVARLIRVKCPERADRLLAHM